jgi:cell division protease FtsH
MIDEEVAKILHEQEDRARQLLTHHRRGLDLVAEALLEKETIEGSEVSRLVQLGLVPSSNGQDADTDVREAHESTPSA